MSPAIHTLLMCVLYGSARAVSLRTRYATTIMKTSTEQPDNERDEREKQRPDNIT